MRCNMNDGLNNFTVANVFEKVFRYPAGSTGQSGGTNSIETRSKLQILMGLARSSEGRVLILVHRQCIVSA